MCKFSNTYVSESIWTIGLDFFFIFFQNPLAYTLTIISLGF